MINIIWQHLIYFGLINAAVIVLGYWLIKQQNVWLTWALMIFSLAIIQFIFLYDHPIIRMLALIATTFNCMKVIAVTADYKGKKLTLSFKQWAIFAGGWAGMRAQPFETLGAPALPGAWPMIRFGISRVIAGGILIFLAHKTMLLPLNKGWIHFITSAELLVGLSLILHFGLLSISAGSWRLSGANTYLLFKQPAKAMSLTEFWSKRWNVAFSEMTSITLFRPLRHKLGPAMALMLAFIFSGVLHEIALSVPVNSGYGLPTLYFIIQGLLVLLEKVLASKGILFLRNKIIARVWTLFWVIVPMPLLFHIEFIKHVVWPLCGLKY